MWYFCKSIFSYTLREDNDGAEEDDKTNEDLIQLLDDKSLSLMMEDAADDVRKMMQIQREHYAGIGKPWVI